MRNKSEAIKEAPSKVPSHQYQITTKVKSITYDNEVKLPNHHTIQITTKVKSITINKSDSIVTTLNQSYFQVIQTEIEIKASYETM
jgi:hypothetical protein